ncbi:MAG: flagellar biosynthetic protein FliO [Treponema sp.]|nr:flagellar biosynthetic protein FliO [Treponema sp.]
MIIFLCLWTVPPPLLFAQETETGDEAVPGGAVEPIPESAILLGDDGPGVPPAPPGTSVFLILRMLLVLALAAAAIYGVVYFLKRASRPPEQRDPHVKVLSSVHLGSNRFVYVVSVGSRAWFLGGGDSGINLITEIEDQDAINAMILAEEQRGSQGRGKGPDFKAMLRRLGIPVDNLVPGADRIHRRRDRLRGLK